MNRTLLALLVFSSVSVEAIAQTAISASDFNGFAWTQFRNFDPGTTFTSTPALGGAFGETITPFPSTLTVDERDFTPNDNSAFEPNAYRYFFSDNADEQFAESAKFDLETGDVGFDLSFDLQLDFGSGTPRKEAGLRFQGNAGGAFSFLATSNGATQGGHIFVAGAGFQFRNFNDDGIFVNSGDVFSMRVIYTPPVRDENDPNIILEPGTQEVRISENGGTEVVHGPFDFTNLEQGLFDETEFWFSQQWQGDTGNASDFATATFSNIVWDDPFASGGADVDDDGDVDGTDFLMIQRDEPSLIPQFQTDYGMTGLGVASVGAVPEPTTFLLSALALVAFAGGANCRTRG